MKEAKKKIPGDIITAAGLLALCILCTLAVKSIDVRPVGPQGSSVGAAGLNQYFHALTGTDMLLYSITDWASIPALSIMSWLAVTGLVQLIKRKSLLRVDLDILISGGLYALVLMVYLFFESHIVNYRPVLIEGVLEASYPSSTTMLMLCTIPTAIVRSQRLIRHRGTRCAVNAIFCAYAAFMVIGRVLSGVHWITDIAGGILFSITLVTIYCSVLCWAERRANSTRQA